MKTRPITPSIEKDLWERWKATVPRTVTLSQAIEELLIADVRKKQQYEKTTQDNHEGRV